MLKSRWMYILPILLFPLMVAADMVSPTGKSFQLLDGREPAKPIQDRGSWSCGHEDHRIDLASGWNAVRDDGVEIGAVNMPFSWDDWDGELILSSKFYVSDTLNNQVFRLVIMGGSGSITAMLNGAHLDTRFGNELSFQLEINPRLLRFGTENELQIILNNNFPRRGGIPLESGIYSNRYYGGITQDIYLKYSPITNIEDIVALWDVIDNYKNGFLKVDLTLQHAGSSPVLQAKNNFVVEYLLLGGDDKVLFRSLRENVKFPPGRVLSLTEKLDISPDIKWNITNKNNLYRLKTLLTGDNLSYSSTAKFGVRTWEVNEKGFQLNGEQIWLRCVNYPSFQAEDGDLLTDEKLEADVLMLKELGAHAVRIMQGSAPLYFLDLCDRYGLLVFEELPVYQVPDGLLSEADLIRSATEQFKAMIMRDRRFTCIAGWGIGSQINPKNKVNSQYYQELIKIARELDDRPLYASFRFMNEFNAEPLDFVILELTPGSKQDMKASSKAVKCNTPFLIGGIRQLVLPGNLNGYLDNESEAGQADNILKKIRWAENLQNCTGVVVGDFFNWKGALPTIAGPLHGKSLVYTSGITNINHKPNLAWHHLKEYWTSGNIQPLPPGEAMEQDGVLLIIAGIALILILFIAARQNNIFRINLVRTFTSTRGFFQDISDRRYFQTGHTFLIAVLISGSLALIMSGWVFANRRSYALDWSLSYLLSNTELLTWAGLIVWHPSRSMFFFWGLLFFMLWIASIRLMILCSILGRSCSLSQSFSYINWSMAGFLITMPLAVIAGRLFTISLGWLIITVILVILLWTHLRLISVIVQHTRKGIGKAVVLWFIGPVILTIALVLFLEYTRYISDYWYFFRGNILP
ncbi:hypothetical protein K9N50_01340 [bacterium]|nr:hypothetical protein [bacterium]